ncbi:hypothetical protein H634G_01304 [Metarhizium anisopliae BRIP 53293]|uniref:Uncharacterized protein n=1 Tax=Metarhizium anisopliae BRIP 53293 TaxID=1291518 RepID=A0A0D9PEE6_METAN|nr:hypothetical protein H634G_01304 [Metarhizium anisopliae BRIP 53293]KJK94612.1 hypothetical protein H633G_01546 [Metarhizium anisopliae BRIP 53284]
MAFSPPGLLIQRQTTQPARNQIANQFRTARSRRNTIFACFGNKIEHDGMITASGAGLFFAGGSYVPSR